MLGQLTLEVELDRADAAPEELNVEGCEPLREVGERPQVRKLLGRERRRVDSEPRQVSGQDRGHLLRDVVGDRSLRLQGRGADVGSGNEVGKREQGVLARWLGFEDVSGCGRYPAGLESPPKERHLT